MNRTIIVGTLATLLLLTFAGSVRAQDIFEVEKAYYTTGKILSVITPGSRQSVLIRSAESLRGSIRFEGTDTEDISLTYRKQARAGTRSLATDYIDLISVTSKLAPDNVVIFLKAPNPAPWNSEAEFGLVELVVSLPRSFSVDLEATYFSITTSGGLKSLSAPNSLGAFDINGITEQVSLATKNQKVTLANIEGRVNVSTTNAPLRAENITCPSVPASFRNEGGEIDIEGFVGQLNVRNKFGRISVADFQLYGDANLIRSSSGPIEVILTGANEGQLVINNRYEDINLTIPDSLSAYLSLSVDEDGSIEAVGFPFTTELVEQDRLNLISGDGTVEIVSSIRGKGSIFVTGIKGD